MEKDLTVGQPRSVLWRFCLPLFGSILFQQLYNVADSLVAGRFVGETALAAVGNSYEVTLIFLAFAFGCSIGCSVVVSRLFGARRTGEMKTAVSTAFLSSAVVCLLLMAVGLTLGTTLLQAMKTPAEAMADSALYLRIYVLGLPFVFLYNVATGVFSALGDSRTPFLFLACSSVGNILVDILFVTAFHMGVAGVAWATFLCQGISCVLAVWTVRRHLGAIPTQGEAVLFSWSLFRQIAVIAVPSILQQSFISVGNLFIQGVINSFGTSVMAGYSAAVKMNNLVITSLTTLGNGISNYTAQNLGAGKPHRVKAGFRAGLGLTWALCLPLMALYFFSGAPLVGLFTDGSAQGAVAVGVQFLQVLSPFYLVAAAKLTADGILRGAGLMGRFMAATFTDLILRVVLAVALSDLLHSPLGIWWAWPVGWCVATVMSLCFYHYGPWRQASPAGEEVLEEAGQEA